MPAHISNFRDLGGIPAAQGYFVAPGKLFRSGHLAHLTPRGGEHLYRKLGIRAVVDLRSNSEVSEKPDSLIEKIDYYKLPPLTDEQNPSVNRKNRNMILNRLMKKEGGTWQHHCDIYRIMVSSPKALDAYHGLLQLLLKEKGEAVLWHCTQGKDRTGIGAAVVLMALGVDRDEIRKDYMTAPFMTRLRNGAIFTVALLFRNLHTAKSLSNLVAAKIGFLEAAFDEIDTRFGGTEAFLKDGLKLTDSDLEALRSYYLVKIGAFPMAH